MITTFTINQSLDEQKNNILERLVKEGHITMAEVFILKEKETKIQNWGGVPNGNELLPWSIPYTYTCFNKGDGAMNATCSQIHTN